MSGLPPSWAELSLVEACKKITDGTHHSPPNTATGEFKYVTAKNIRRHGLDLADLTYVSAEVHRGIYERCPVERGDVLYIKDGATTGLAINNPLDEPFSMLSSVALLKPDRRLLDERYLRHWLNSPETLASMIGQMSGSAIKRLTLTTISWQRLPLPPLAEQRRIVAKLDALTARTARARADLDRIPALAARYKQAVLAKAFSGELTAEWRAHHSQAAATVGEQDRARKLAWSNLPRRRGKYEVADAADWMPEQFELPKSWRWASVDELASLLQYGSSAKTSDEPAVPVLRMGNIVDGQLDLGKLKYLPKDHEEFPDLLLEDGDLLFNRTNSPELVGKTAVFRGVDGSMSFASYLIRLKSVGYHPELLAAYINSSFGRSWVATATSQQVGQANVNGTKLRGLGVPLMPPDEQLIIWQRIKSAFAEIDRLAAEAAAARRLLDRLDQAILAKAFRGKLVPQDPADEPAGVLLDRIRAERAP